MRDPRPGDLAQNREGARYRVARVWSVAVERGNMVSSVELDPEGGGDRIRVTRREWWRDWDPVPVATPDPPG
jgi:hypothetical protein